VSRFFVAHPIFAWVIAILVMLLGVLAITRLPVEQYPAIAPPTITVSATYPGASAQTVEDSVTQIIEQSMSGLDHLLYLSSVSDATGSASITLTFAGGTNPDTAQVQVQNKLQSAIALLPAEVQQQGVTVSKDSNSILMAVAFISTTDKVSLEDLEDFAATNFQEPVSRVSGVGGTRLFGSKHAMRIWLDPNKLEAYGLTPADVTAAIVAQNAEVAAGQIGGLPAVVGQGLNATITARGRLRTVDEFRAIVLRGTQGAATLRLGDVARVELGAADYGYLTRFNGKPATGVMVNLATNANALDTERAVQALIKQISPTFPPGVKVVYPVESAPFIRASIREVIKTLFEAILLVFLVMYLFLQNLRATLIPTIAVPVVLLGTFALLYAFGYSINLLTMFGMVLAIGLLVDDAIVVVENVERVMRDEGLDPRAATLRSMDEITGALVGIATVLAAVFLPMAFLEGSTGVIYRQFSVTIVSAMALSVLVALILSPALCATILKPVEPGGHGALGRFFGAFNQRFERATLRYQARVGRSLRHSGRSILVFLVLTGIMGFLFLRLPGSFLPVEDQGHLFTIVQGPAGATQERTLRVLDQVEQYYTSHEQSAIQSVFTIGGFGFNGVAQNAGLAFILLKDWDQRPSPAQQAEPITRRAFATLIQIKDAMVFAIAPPAVQGLGQLGGFDFYLRDNLGRGHEALIGARNQLLQAAGKDKLLRGVRPAGQEDSPELRIDIDAAKVSALGLSMADVDATLEVAWGGRYIDDFIDRSRVKRVYLQADAPFRMYPKDFDRWYVRNAAGSMVPTSAFAGAHWELGSPRLERFNAASAVEINGDAAPGVSSGTAMREMARLVSELPAGFSIDWAGQSYEEQSAGAQMPALYTLSLVVIFLCLAALYESWLIPVSILLAVPIGVIGAVIATTLRGLESDVYFQVAVLTTIGLTSKNAILIVEFAEANRRAGVDLVAATLQAVKDRLRPILMTSLAFGLGIVPLVLTVGGASAGAQHAIGTGVVGGVITGTFLGIFFIPVFYVVVQKLAGAKRGTVADA
jgi:multidrug efflux pump